MNIPVWKLYNLTHWDLDNSAGILQLKCLDLFSWMKIWYYNSNVPDICSSGSNWQHINMVLSNGLLIDVICHYLTQANDLDLWCHMTPLGLSEFMYWSIWYLNTSNYVNNQYVCFMVWNLHVARIIIKMFWQDIQSCLALCPGSLGSERIETLYMEYGNTKFLV